jgi:5-methylcytosine-specific restriction protein A
MTTGTFADRRRGTRHERGYGSAWVQLRKRILARDGGLCVPCSRNHHVTLATAVDHIQAKELGGSDAEENLQSICSACHQTKTSAEALSARGAAQRIAPAACSADGIPTDPRHPWNRRVEGGV